MSKVQKQVKILQFNQMKGVQKGSTEQKDGEMLLEGQKTQQLPGKYFVLEVDS